jgi:predicted nuclease of predicted toxin-antitoxin system
MNIIVDNMLSPDFADFMAITFNLEAFSINKMGLGCATDVDIRKLAIEMGAIVVTKDKDFAELHAQHGTPPRLIWLTISNTSNTELQQIFLKHETAISHFMN